MENVVIDKDIVDTLRGLYFGSYTDIFHAAGLRAYRDFNRTLHFGDYPEEDRKHLRTTAIDALRDSFDTLGSTQVSSQNDFDSWHKSCAENLIQLYAAENLILTYGQAQKWINMTAKYLYVSGERDFNGVFAFLHIPIDNYVMDIAKRKFGIAKPRIAWSKWNYQQYNDYQTALRSNITDESPLRWEFHNWLEEARDYVEIP